MFPNLAQFTIGSGSGWQRFVWRGHNPTSVQKCLETGETIKSLEYGKSLEICETTKSLVYGNCLDVFLVSRHFTYSKDFVLLLFPDTLPIHGILSPGAKLSPTAYQTCAEQTLTSRSLRFIIKFGIIIIIIIIIIIT